MIVVGFALAVVMFWPLVLHLDRDVPKDLGDSLLVAYLIGWNGHAFLHQPFEWWQASVLWPNHDALAFSDAFIGYTPVALLGTGFRAAIWHYNVLFLSAYALAFAGAYLLARELGLGRPTAAVAGVAFAYSPWRWDQSAHLHVLSSGGIPLCLMLLLRGYRRGRPRAVIAGWLVAAWQVLIGVSLGLQLLYLLAILAAVAAVIWWWWTTGARAPHPARHCRRARCARHRLRGGGEAISERRRRIPRVAPEPFVHRVLLAAAASPSSAPAENLVWGELTGGAREGLAAVGEQSLFPGALVLALALFGLFSRVWPRSLRLGLAAAVLTAAVFSMGLEFLGGRFHLPAALRLCPRLGRLSHARQATHAHDPFLALLAAAGAHALVSPDGPLRMRGRPWLGPMVCLAFVVVILLEGSAFRSTGGTLAAPAHPTVRAPPSGLRHAQGPLMHLPADEASDSTDDPLTYRYMVWSTEGFPSSSTGSAASYLAAPSSLASLHGGSRTGDPWRPCGLRGSDRSCFTRHWPPTRLGPARRADPLQGSASSAGWRGTSWSTTSRRALRAHPNSDVVTPNTLWWSSGGRPFRYIRTVSNDASNAAGTHLGRAGVCGQHVCEQLRARAIGGAADRAQLLVHGSDAPGGGHHLHLGGTRAAVPGGLEVQSRRRPRRDTRRSRAGTCGGVSWFSSPTLCGSLPSGTRTSRSMKSVRTCEASFSSGPTNTVRNSPSACLHRCISRL